MFVFQCLVLFLLLGFSERITSTVSWDANTENDLAGYKIYHGPESGIYDNVIDVGNVTNFDIEFYPGTHYIVVTAYDLAGNESNFSKETVYDYLVDSNRSFHVSPNPFYDYVKVEAFGLVTIYNILGQVVSKENVNGIWYINMSDHPRGIYFFEYGNRVMKRTKL